jgi:hypothetical protein
MSRSEWVVYIFCLGFIFILHHQTSAQSSSGLLKKIETTFNGTTLSSNEYAGQEKTEYGYDSNNRIIYEVKKDRDLEKEKEEISEEKFYEYDEWGNNSFYKWIVYQFYPDSISYIVIDQNNYKDSLLLYKYEGYLDYNWQNSGKKYKDERTTTYTYTNDIKTHTFIYQEEGYYEIPELTRHTIHYYYNNQGQPTNYSKFTLDTYNNESYDTTIHYYQGECHLGWVRDKAEGIYGFLTPVYRLQKIYTQGSCSPDTIKWYTRDYDSDDDELVLKTVQVNIKDANQKIIKECHYRPQIDSSNLLTHLWEYEYSDSGQKIRETITFLRNNGMWQEIQEYNSYGNLIYLREQETDTLIQEWITLKETINKYNADNRMISSNSKFDWDPQLQEFIGYRNQEIMYNENDLMIEYEESSYRFDYSYAEYIDYYKHILGEDRCDGNYNTKIELVQRQHITEGFTRSSIYEKKSTYAYYDIALCEAITEEKNEMNLFPNPSYGDLHILTYEILIDPVLKITNSIGQVLLLETLSSGNYFNIKLDGLCSGIYIVKLHGNEKEYNGRMVYIQ